MVAALLTLWPGPAVAAPDTATAEPLVSSWTVTSYRGLFGVVDAGTRNNLVPIRSGAACPPGASFGTVGGLSSTRGRALTVRAACSGTAARVTFAGAGGAIGDYTGTVDLVPTDKDKGNLTLTVRHTDRLPGPLLVLLLGIVLAMGAARQTGRLNLLSRSEEWAARVEGQAEDADRDFRAAAAGTPWTGYTVLPAARSTVQRALGRLHGLRAGFESLDREDSTYRQVSGELDRLRALVASWPGLAGRLAALRDAVDVVASVPGRPGLPDPAPALVGTVRAGVLIGAELSVAEAEELMDEVAALTVLARVWPIDAREAHALGLRADRLSAVRHPAAPAMLQAARTRINEVVRQLWSVADLDGYRQSAIRTGLTRAAAELDTVESLAEELMPMGRDAPAGDPTPRTEVPRPAPPHRPTPKARAAAIGRTRRLRNLLVLAAFALVTVWAGLTTLYFDRAFGSARDYLTILLWGFGAQTLLASLATALDHAAGREREVPA